MAKGIGKKAETKDKKPEVKAKKEAKLAKKVEIASKPVEPPKLPEKTAKMPKMKKVVKKEDTLAPKMEKIRSLFKAAVVTPVVQEEASMAESSAAVNKADDLASKPTHEVVNTHLDAASSRRSPPAAKKHTAAPGKITMEDIERMQQAEQPTNSYVNDIMKYIKK